MKKVNKPRILERLRTRLSLTDLEREIFSLPETVTLVTSVDELLKEWQCKIVGTFTRTAVQGTGVTSAFTIPDGKRYHVRAIKMSRTSGDATISNLYLLKDDDILVHAPTAGAVISTKILEQDLIMDEGFSFLVTVASITTDSVFSVSLYYAEEDAF